MSLLGGRRQRSKDWEQNNVFSVDEWKKDKGQENGKKRVVARQKLEANEPSDDGKKK